MTTSSPIQELEPGATPSVVGVALLAILTDRPQQKNTLIMIMQDPAEGVEPLALRHPCGRCGWAILTDRQQPKQINTIL